MAEIFPLSAQNVYVIVRNAARDAGLDKVRPHDLRRSYARLCRSGGASMEQIQRTLGHASVQTTERYLNSQLEIAPGRAACDFIQFGTNGRKEGTAIE